MKFEIEAPDGRIFTRIGIVPYTTKDNRKIKMMKWQGICTDCGEPFFVLAFQQILEYDKSKNFQKKICDDCRNEKPILLAKKNKALMHLLGKQSEIVTE